MSELWRLADRMAAGHVPAKRLRPEFDELAPGGAAYYPREELRYEDRDRHMFPRETNTIGYGSALTRGDISAATGGHLGLSGHGALNVGLSGRDDSLLGLSSGRMLNLDSGFVKPSSLSDYLSKQDSQVPRSLTSLPLDASPTLFVEGLPSDCSKREAAHVFRPYNGYQEVRLVRKEGKRAGGDPLVLCFVDFTDAQHAANALKALQGYKFDETSRDSETLRLQFARARGGRDDVRGRDRDEFSRGGRSFQR